VAPRKRKQTRNASKVVIVPVLIPIFVFVETKVEESEKKAGWREWLASTHQGLAILLALVTLAGLLTAASCRKQPDPPKPITPSITVVVDDRDVLINMAAPPSACAPPKKRK
jgi:hypothetical protein